MFHKEVTGNIKVLLYSLLWSKVIHNKITI